MREGDLCPQQSDKQSVEARLSSSCPSLVVDSGDEVDSGQARSPVSARGQAGGHRSGGQQRTTNKHGTIANHHRKARSGRARSPSVSTGESDEDTVSDCVDTGGGGVTMGVAGPGLMTTSGVGHNLHKSVSTPSMVQHDSHVHSSQQSANKST